MFFVLKMIVYQAEHNSLIDIQRKLKYMACLAQLLWHI